MTRTPSRRDVLRSAGLLALGGTAGLTGAGCGTVRSGLTGAAPAANVLTYWNLLGGGDGVRMKEMEAVYQQAHPEVDLQAVTLTWGNPYYTKLSLATLGAQPPDVAISHLTRVQTLAAAKVIQPFPADAMAAAGMTPDKFVRTAVDGATIDGQLYAIPLDTHPFVMFYNTDVCKKAGLLDSSGRLMSLDDPDTFAEALAKAKQVTGTYGGVVSTIADTATSWRIFHGLYKQLGGRLLTGSSPDEIIEDEPALHVMRYIRGLTVDQQVMPTDIDYGGAVAAFASGRSGFFFQGEWEVSTFLAAKMPFSMERFPQLFGDTYAVHADSHTFVLPSRDPVPRDRLDVVLGFVRSMLDQGIAWAGGGHVPTWLPTQESAEYKQIKPQSNYAAVAADAAYDPSAWFSGSGSNFEVICGSALGEAFSGRSTPEAALARIKDGISKLARTPSPL